jgi:hypothetical protein
MPTTANGFVYPASSDNTQLWTHFQNLADSIETKYAALDSVNPRHADLTRATTQSIANGTNSYVSWTVETNDTHGFIAVTSDTVTIPAGQGGVYSLSAFARYVANATGFRVLAFEISGTQTAQWRAIAHATGGQPTDMAVSLAAVRLAAGATIKMFTFQNSGAALNIDNVVPPRLTLIRAAV